MRFRSVAVDAAPHMDMTPVIDIVFNLLLFFLLSSTYVQHTALEVNLPRAGESAAVEGEAIVVDLTSDNRLFLNNEPVMPGGLLPGLTALTADNPTRRLLLNADENARHGSVVAVLDIARKAGIANLDLATVPERSTE